VELFLAQHWAPSDVEDRAFDPEGDKKPDRARDKGTADE